MGTQTTTKKDKNLVRQLLAIAGDPSASQNERDQAQLRASMLMARLMINELDLDDGNTEQITTRDIIVMGGPTTASSTQAAALHRIARAAGASTYSTLRLRETRERGRGPHIVVHVVGYPSDLDQLMPLLTAVQAHAAVGWRAWTRTNPRRYKPMKPATRRATRDGYILGWGDAIATRMRAARANTIAQRDQDTPTGSASTALVVRSRDQRITDYLNTLGLIPGKTLNPDYRAYHDGQRDAQASGLGTNPNTITHRD